LQGLAVTWKVAATSSGLASVICTVTARRTATYQV